MKHIYKTRSLLLKSWLKGIYYNSHLSNNAHVAALQNQRQLKTDLRSNVVCRLQSSSGRKMYLVKESNAALKTRTGGILSCNTIVFP